MNTSRDLQVQEPSVLISEPSVLISEPPASLSREFVKPLPKMLSHYYTYLNGTKYHYVASPCQNYPQKLIVFLHGFPEVWVTWKKQMQLFMKSKQYRVVALDLVGYGQSDVPKDLSKYTYQSVGSDIINLVKSELKYKKVILIGHNWGSYVGFHIARIQPKLVSAVISLSSGYYPTPLLPKSLISNAPQLGYQLNLANPDNCQQFDENISEFLEAFWSYDYPSLSESCLVVPPEADFIQFVRNISKKHTNFPSSDIKQFITDQFRQTGTWGATNWYRTSELNYEIAQHLPNYNLTLPVMLMVGKDDFAAPAITAGTHYLSNHVVKVIPEAGHFLHISHANIVFTIIYRWLTFLKI